MWKDLTIQQKSEVMKMAIGQGVTDLNEIKNMYDSSVSTGESLSYNNTYDSVPEYPSPKDVRYAYGGPLGNVYKGKGNRSQKLYTPSDSIKAQISRWEGSSMYKPAPDTGKVNRSFEDEANSFISVMPTELLTSLPQESLDALFSLSYNIGAGNFKKRVVPTLTAYHQGNATIEDVQAQMYGTRDKEPKMKGLRTRRAAEREMFANALQRLDESAARTEAMYSPATQEMLNTKWQSPIVEQTPTYNPQPPNVVPMEYTPDPSTMQEITPYDPFAPTSKGLFEDYATPFQFSLPIPSRPKHEFTPTPIVTMPTSQAIDNNYLLFEPMSNSVFNTPTVFDTPSIFADGGNLFGEGGEVDSFFDALDKYAEQAEPYAAGVGLTGDVIGLSTAMTGVGAPVGATIAGVANIPSLLIDGYQTGRDWYKKATGDGQVTWWNTARDTGELVADLFGAKIALKYADRIGDKQVVNYVRDRVEEEIAKRSTNRNLSLLKKKGMSDAEAAEYIAAKATNAVSNSANLAKKRKDEKVKAQRRGKVTSYTLSAVSDAAKVSEEMKKRRAEYRQQAAPSDNTRVANQPRVRIRALGGNLFLKNS